MYCTNCGAQIDDNATFCTSCGAKTEVTSESVQATQVIEPISAPITEPVASNAFEDHAEKPKELRKPIDKRIIIGAVVAVAVVVAIAIGMFVVQKLSSAQGTWYMYDDHGDEYVLILDADGEGQDRNGDFLTWNETNDTATVGNIVFKKEGGKLQAVTGDYAYFKNESDAKANYDARVKEMREKCDQYIGAVKKGFEGTWSYKYDETKCTLVVNDDGTWNASSKYKVSSLFSNSITKASHNGTWTVNEVEDSELPNFEDEIVISIAESTESSYGDPINHLNAAITADGNNAVVVSLGDCWVKTSDEADDSKLKSSEKKEKTGKSDGEEGEKVVHLSVMSKSGKKLESDVRLKDGNYVIPDSSERVYEKDELKALNLSDAELCIARNEILAREGQTFIALKSYFEDRDWYKDEGKESVNLTKISNTNLKRITKLITDKQNWLDLKGQKN